ncbi:DUF1858 domain-containing protein [Candidatus Pacearchaeota archaeon]|nr:DUF1858 domain-containing protein [Candidatus Pacearchaeota archaeon]
MKTKKINKKDKIRNIIINNPQAAKVLWEEGLSCVECPIAIEETLEEGCILHGIDVNKVVNKLNSKKI